MKSETRTYTITALPRQWKTIEAIFSYIEYLGNIGHSTGFMLYVDGDGGARVKFQNEVGEDILDINSNREYIKSKMNADHDIKSFGIE